MHILEYNADEQQKLSQMPNADVIGPVHEDH